MILKVPESEQACHLYFCVLSLLSNEVLPSIELSDFNARLGKLFLKDPDIYFRLLEPHTLFVAATQLC